MKLAARLISWSEWSRVFHIQFFTKTSLILKVYMWLLENGHACWVAVCRQGFKNSLNFSGNCLVIHVSIHVWVHPRIENSRCLSEWNRYFKQWREIQQLRFWPTDLFLEELLSLFSAKKNASSHNIEYDKINTSSHVSLLTSTVHLHVFFTYIYTWFLE